MEETYLLLNGELDNNHFDVLFSLEEKRTGIADDVFYMQPSPKHSNNSTLYKYKLREFKDRVIMKIFRLKMDGVIACWGKNASKKAL